MPRCPKSTACSTTRRSCGRRATCEGKPRAGRSGRDRCRISSTASRARCRAFLQVQQGCDHRCTFCIIPYARGASRSVPIGVIADQARRLVAAGYREIVLTGVDLTAYGADLPGRPSLGQMVRRLLAAVPELRAPAPLLARPGRDRRGSVAAARRGGAADAASAFVAAGRRRSDPEAHEAAPFAAPRRSPRRGAPARCAPRWRSAPI